MYALIYKQRGSGVRKCAIYIVVYMNFLQHVHKYICFRKNTHRATQHWTDVKSSSFLTICDIQLANANLLWCRLFVYSCVALTVTFYNIRLPGAPCTSSHATPLIFVSVFFLSIQKQKKNKQLHDLRPTFIWRMMTDNSRASVSVWFEYNKLPTTITTTKTFLSRSVCIVS